MLEKYKQNIGKKCIKTSKRGTVPKPFKSGLKTNTIKDVITHPILLDQLAYIFEEDDSYVEVRRCIIKDYTNNICISFTGLLNEPHFKCETCGREEWEH